MSEKNALGIIAKYSPKNFCELKLVYGRRLQSELQSEELESFFVSWADRIAQKSLSLFASGRYNGSGLDKNIKIINKYIKLGVVKKFDNILYSGYFYCY